MRPTRECIQEEEQRIVTTIRRSAVAISLLFELFMFSLKTQFGFQYAIAIGQCNWVPSDHLWTS